MHDRILNMISAAALGLALMVLPAESADKGGPPSKIDIQGEPKNFNGCFVSVAGSTTFLEVSGFGDAARMFLAGAGCDLQRGKIVVGASAEYGFGESDARLAAMSARAGITLNAHTLLYGFTSLTMDGRDPKLGDSIWSLGAGIETYLLSKNWTIAVEGSTAIKAFGDAAGVDMSQAKVILRYRF
jgi:hypothetical protein